ncbi:MAG: glycosyltransferase [Flavobacteriales bacterium]|nr:glycosyltransferase [Flavobacteriales bacterium]
MKVSIITSSYNSSETIADTISSVNSQTHQEIEHVFIDGKSSDNSVEIINEISTREKIVTSEKDKGIYDAMNKGVAKSNGDVIAILNSDDFYADENVVSDVVALFTESGADAVYADLDYVTEDTTKIVRKWRSGSYKHGMFKWGWMPPHPTLFVKKEVYEKYGNFNLDLKSAADYEIMLRFIHKHEIKLAYLQRVTVKMRVGGLSNSSIKHRLFANNEDRKAWKINGLRPYFFTLYLKPLRKIVQYF